jgi:hypothetical protein
LYALDENGNSTQLSPHNKDGLWWYNSTNVETGKTLQIEMERLTKDINKLLGGGYIAENNKIIDLGDNVINKLQKQTKKSDLTIEELQKEIKSKLKDNEEEIDVIQKISKEVQQTVEMLVLEIKDIWEKIYKNEKNIENMEKENDELKKELCKKDASYSWCEGINGNKNDEKKDEELKIADEQEQDKLIEEKNQNGNGVDGDETVNKNEVVLRGKDKIVDKDEQVNNLTNIDEKK